MMLVHFSAFISIAAVLGHSQAPTRRLSAETEALVNSRLIFVYDDGECRELEGLQEYGPTLDGPGDMPYHRMRALGELERRITEQWKERSDYRDRTRSLEQISDPPAVHTLYLEALQMEIANVPEGMSLQDLEQIAHDLPCVKFISRDDVKFAEPEPTENIDSDRFVKALENERSTENYQSNPPSDPLWRYQWGLQKGDEESFGINAEAVWNEHDWRGSPDMVIAIIDSGCNLNHPDMTGKFWRNPGETDCNDGIDNDGNGFIDDCWGWDFVEEDNEPQAKGTSHGTAAAGIIAARSNNTEGVVGICWECQLMCLRFISNTEGTVANEVRAIDYAVRMGAKISNNSYGGYAHSGSRVEQEAIERANKKGHLFVTSAGNNNIGTDSSEYIHTPSGYPVANILAVGASTESGRKTSFSNWGAQTVHMFAPGRNVISTGRDGYLINQGTSFAAPHVAGVAGLIWSRFPQLSADEIVAILMDSCRSAVNLKGLAKCGGVINAELAYRRAKQLVLEKEEQSLRNGVPVQPSTGYTALQDTLRKLPSILRPVISALARMPPLGATFPFPGEAAQQDAINQGLLPLSRRRPPTAIPMPAITPILAPTLPPLPPSPFQLPTWATLWNPFAPATTSTTPTVGAPEALSGGFEEDIDDDMLDADSEHPSNYDWELLFDCHLPNGREYCRYVGRHQRQSRPTDRSRRMLEWKNT